MRILLVDQEQLLLESLSQKLADQNYIVDAVRDGKIAWEFAATYNYALIILASNLPSVDGITLCQRWRSQGYHLPILFLTSSNRSQDKVKALEAGADDCLSKPLDFEELLARIKALLRRVKDTCVPELTGGDLVLDLNSCQVSYQNQLLALTAKEYALIELLLRHQEGIVTIEEIVDHLWSSDEYPSEATVRSHLRRLREKLKEAGAPDNLIETVRGLGYRLKTKECHKFKEIQIQSLKVSASAWHNYREKSCHQLTILKETVDQLHHDTLTPSAYHQAQATLSNLAENLHILGCFEGVDLVRKLELLLQDSPYSQPEQSWQFEALLTALHHQLEINNSLDRPRFSTQSCPLLLILGEDSPSTRQLASLANHQGINTSLLDTPDLIKKWLKKLSNPSKSQVQRADLILLKVAFTRSNDPDLIALTLSERLCLISEINLRAPSLPIVVITDSDQFLQRLELTRRGARFCLSETLFPCQILHFIQTTLNFHERVAKVMIVDQDRDLLRILPSLLQPWGLEITTLDDPELFWEVLQALKPDLLVLNLVNNQVSGIDLCKVLRSHPAWACLPVVMIAEQVDRFSESQIFGAGADDLILKPFAINDFAHRLLARLDRIKWQSELICGLE